MILPGASLFLSPLPCDLTDYTIVVRLGHPRRVRQPLNDFEPWAAALLAVFERWEALVFLPRVLLRWAGLMRISPDFPID